MKIVGALILAAEVAAEDGTSAVYASTAGTLAQCKDQTNIPLSNRYVAASTPDDGEDGPAASTATDATCFVNNSTARADDSAFTAANWPDFVYVNNCQPSTGGAASVTGAGVQMIPMTCGFASSTAGECTADLPGEGYVSGMLLGVTEITGNNAFILTKGTSDTQACGWTKTEDDQPVPTDGGETANNVFQTSNKGGDMAVLQNTNIFKTAIGTDNWQACTDEADKNNCVSYAEAEWNLARMGISLFGFQGGSCSGPAIPLGYLTCPPNDDDNYGKCITMIPTTGAFPSWSTPDPTGAISWNVDYNTTSDQNVGENGERAYDGGCSTDGVPNANATLTHGILGTDVNPVLDDENIQYLLGGDCAVDTTGDYSFQTFAAVPDAWCPNGNCKQSKSSAAAFGTALIGALYALIH